MSRARQLHGIRNVIAALSVSAAFIASEAGAAQATAESAGTKRVVAGARYRKGGLYRWLFGSNYRKLWLTPFDAEVLDLGTYGGGITPTRVVGHGQSKSLAFQAADGRLYTFRPLLKDPSGLLPIELRETFATRFIVDQMASGHPAAQVIVPPLLEAAQVLHNEPRIAVMPDDPRLGEFRDDFKGVLGDIEEYGGSPGLVAAEDNIDGEELWRRTRESPAVRVDARAYLRARLIDQLIGDWDRHRNQWRWVKLAGNPLWQPIPEDRDQAFVKFNGIAISVLRPSLPLLVDFGKDYSSMEGLTFDGSDVDRRLLAGLERPAFEEEAATVQRLITDAVIDAAARRMPPEYFAHNGAVLAAALKHRRDALAEQAVRFYEFLAKQVDVYATDVAENVDVERGNGGDVTVKVAADAGAPYFQRTFHEKETREVRLLLFGGDDRVVTRGKAGAIVLRVVGGEGDDNLDDSAGGKTRFYESGTLDKVVPGPGTWQDRGVFVAPPVNRSGDWIPPRDWGRRNVWLLRVGGGTDLGVVPTVALLSTRFGFRKFPYAEQHRASLSFSSSRKAFRGVYEFDRRFENSPITAGLTAIGSGYEIFRFYGFGNDSPAIDPDDRAKIENDQFIFAPRLTLPVGKLSLSFESVLKYTFTEPRGNPVFSGERAVSTKTIGQLGAGFAARFDTTDKPAWPSRGVRIWSHGHIYPKAWGLDDTFGELHAEASTYLSPSAPGKVILMLRGGGKHVFGDYPYFEAAFLGGRPVPAADESGDGAGVVRGLRQQRFAGDGVLYANTELRLSLGNVFVFVPGEIGVLGLFDIGRIYFDGDSPSANKWHHGVGGGLWFASPNRRNSVTVSAARSEGRLGIYIKTGLAF